MTTSDFLAEHVQGIPVAVPKPYSKTVIAAMRSWCADVFSDYPSDARDSEVVRCVRQQYGGGVAAFLTESDLEG